jgi:hypothetical protein
MTVLSNLQYCLVVSFSGPNNRFIFSTFCLTLKQISALIFGGGGGGPGVFIQGLVLDRQAGSPRLEPCPSPLLLQLFFK